MLLILWMLLSILPWRNNHYLYYVFSVRFTFNLILDVLIMNTMELSHRETIVIHIFVYCESQGEVISLPGCQGWCQWLGSGGTDDTRSARTRTPPSRGMRRIDAPRWGPLKHQSRQHPLVCRHGSRSFHINDFITCIF